MSTRFKARLSATVAGAFVIAALLAAPLQAQAAEAGTLVQSCSAAEEVCRDVHSNWQGGAVVTLRTITSNVGSGSASYEVRKGNPFSGTLVCSGTMGYNATTTCNVGSYSGQLTFVFWKLQNSLTTISMS